MDRTDASYNVCFPRLTLSAVEVYFETLLFKSHEPLFMHSAVSRWLLTFFLVTTSKESDTDECKTPLLLS